MLVSQDNTISDFNEYYAGMLWPAVPFGDQTEQVFTACGVDSLPTVLALRVADGSVVSKDCRELINTKKKLAGIFS